MRKKNKDLTGYHSGINWLYEHRPYMADYVASLGSPVSTSGAIDTAMVCLNHKNEVELHVNNDFFMKWNEAQRGGLLAHEFNHILLSHIQDFTNPHYTNRDVLTIAQEVVINDHLLLAKYELPDDGITGKKINGKFYGFHTTREAYDELLVEMQQNPQDNQENKNSSEDSSEGETSEDSYSNDSGDSSSEGSSSDSSSGSSSSSSSDSSQEQTSGSGTSQEDVSQNDSNPSEDSQGDSGNTSEDVSDGASNAAGESNHDDSGKPSDSNANDHKDSMCATAKAVDKDGNYSDLTPEQAQTLEEKLKKAIINAAKKADTSIDNGDSLPTLEQVEAGGDMDIADAVHPMEQGTISKKAGDTGELSKIMNDERLKGEWLRLLRHVDPTIGREGTLAARASANWSKPRRNISMVSNVILPSPGAPRGKGLGAGSSPMVLFALDFSGSVPRYMTQVMAALAKSIPEDKISPECITFSTIAVPFNHKADFNKTASGGTDFSCVHDYAIELAKKNRGKYPYVFCLTDGHAKFERNAPDQSELDSRWFWVDIETEDDAMAFMTNQYYKTMDEQKNKFGIPFDLSSFSSHRAY